MELSESGAVQPNPIRRAEVSTHPCLADRLEQAIQYRVDDPDFYDLTEEQHHWYDRLHNEVKIPYIEPDDKSTKVTLPFYGLDHPAHEELASMLKIALEDARDFDSDTLSYQAATFQEKRIENFVTTGRWSIPRASSPKKPKPCAKQLAWQKEVEAKAHELLNEQIDFLVKDCKHIINLNRTLFKTDIQFKLSWHESRGSSWGGTRVVKGFRVPWVSLALNGFSDPAKELYTFSEYSHIAKSKFVGSLVDVDWVTELAALVAHELSHAAIHFMLYALPKPRWTKEYTRKQMREPHGDYWRSIYRELRIKFVNKPD
jgi:hypothetical protein